MNLRHLRLWIFGFDSNEFWSKSVLAIRIIQIRLQKDLKKPDLDKISKVKIKQVPEIQGLLIVVPKKLAENECKSFRLYGPFLALCFQSLERVQNVCRAWLFEINYHSLLYAKLFTPLTGHNGSVEFQASSYFEIRFADPISFCILKKRERTLQTTLLFRHNISDVSRQKLRHDTAKSSGAICAEFLKWSLIDIGPPKRPH